MTSSERAPAGASPWDRFGAAGAALSRTLREGRIGPAYLFEGPDEAVARDAARLFAAGLLCAAEGQRPCLACSSCRRSASGNHPDLHLQGRDKATVISVEAMEPLLARAHLAPMEGRRQAFVVEPADALAPEGVARYLKTLEEPPPASTFLLVTARPDRLPDAVRSRCQRVRLLAPTEAEIAQRLRGGGLDADRAWRVARAAGASAARADRLARAGILDVVDRLVAAAVAPAASIATAADAAVETLRRVAPEAAPREDAGGGETAPVPAGESLREVLDDLFHALQALGRDRAAGRPAGPLDAVPVEAAAAALAEWSRVAPFVRRNVTPAALVIEAGAILRRAVRTGAPVRG